MQALSSKELKKCISMAVGDAKKLLGAKELDKVFNSKLGSLIDPLIKGYGVTFDGLKEYYNLYKTAKSAIGNCRKAQKSGKINDILSALSSTMNLMNFQFSM